MKNLLLILSCVVTLTQSLSAQSSEGFERVLLPIATVGEVPGAHGSRWTSRLAITNVGESPVVVDGISTKCRVTGCMPESIPAGATLLPNPENVLAGTPAAFIFVEEGRTDDVVVELRFQDLSRQEQTWGTEVPVVTVNEARADEVNLTDVPIGERFRQLLRVYDLNPREGVTAVVRAYAISGAAYPVDAVPDTTIFETTVNLITGRGDRLPGYAQLPLWDIPSLEGHERVRIEVIPEEGSLLWAFVSITSNETQHVTLVTPGGLGR